MSNLPKDFVSLSHRIENEMTAKPGFLRSASLFKLASQAIAFQRSGKINFDQMRYLLGLIQI